MTNHTLGMPADPLIDEVRRIRREICEAHGNDVDRLARHLSEFEKAFADRVVTAGSHDAADVPASTRTDTAGA